MQQQSRGYQGLACQCQACQALTDEERRAKQDRIQAARSAGGKARAAQPSMQDARRAGFQATMESHPFFARKWLRRKIKDQSELRQRKAAKHTLLAGQPAGRRRAVK